MRVVQVRTGVVLDRDGGALAKMLPPFRLGVGGPVAGGRQYISWIHRDDLIGLILAAVDETALERCRSTPRRPNRSPIATSPGRSAGSCGRPSLVPVPGSALRLLYGEMAEIVTTGARVCPPSRSCSATSSATRSSGRR